jgi:hypothetical protein
LRIGDVNYDVEKRKRKIMKKNIIKKCLRIGDANYDIEKRLKSS